MPIRLGIVGITGLVGNKIIESLKLLNIKYSFLSVFASRESRGSIIKIGDEDYIIDTFQLEYMKDYILAPLMVSSHEVIIGIIILDELISKPLFKSTDILESNNYLSQINSINPKDSKDILNNMEYLCDILNGILAMDKNNLPTKMKLYIMNCRGYIPRVLIRRMPKKMTSINFFQNRLNP
jgi:hypothetical protein